MFRKTKIFCGYGYLTLIFLVAFLGGSLLFAFASTTDGTIDSVYKYAWSENIGWISFGTGAAFGNVHVANSGLTGYAWSQNYGWINLNPTGYGVKNDGAGNLSGYAWGQQVGWINFSGVVINSSGVFTGMATGNVTGRINFNCTNTPLCKVVTDWRPTAAAGVIPSYGGGGGSYYTTSTPPVLPPAATTTPPSATSSGFLAQPVLTYPKAPTGGVITPPSVLPPVSLPGPQPTQPVVPQPSVQPLAGGAAGQPSFFSGVVTGVVTNFSGFSGVVTGVVTGVVNNIGNFFKGIFAVKPPSVTPPPVKPPSVGVNFGDLFNGIRQIFTNLLKLIGF